MVRLIDLFIDFFVGTEKVSQLCCCPKRAWGQSAVHCFISSGLPWPPFPIGFSVAIWLKIEEVSKEHQVSPSDRSSKGYSSSLVFSSINTGKFIKCHHLTGHQRDIRHLWSSHQ